VRRRKESDSEEYREELDYGVTYDDYSEESGNPNFENGEETPVFPHDNLTDEQLAKLSGEVRIVKM
jgi:hypothetical protein